MNSVPMRAPSAPVRRTSAKVPRSEIPEGREARIDWLFGWWEEIDAWIEQNRPKDLSSGRHR